MDIKNVLLSIAIIILTVFVVVYGINMFYASPEYEDFCEDRLTDKPIEVLDSQEKCVQAGGQWTDSFAPDERSGFCDRDYSCRQDYDDAREKYSRTLFFLTLPIGLIIIFLGGYFFHLTAVGAGFMGGGIVTLLYGVMHYWNYGNDWLKFLLSLIGLGILVWFTYWINNRKKPKK